MLLFGQLFHFPLGEKILLEIRQRTKWRITMFPVCQN